MYECAICGHPLEDHVTGRCLQTLECLCCGYQPPPAAPEEEPDALLLLTPMGEEHPSPH